MEWYLLSYFVLGVMLRPTNTQVGLPDTVFHCCEGDILLLLDSSGSVSSYEFSRLVRFLTELLRPFSLGSGRVRVGLLQVGTWPRLEFGLEAHSNQADLRGALLGSRQLKGDTNTEAALKMARQLLTRAETEAGPERDVELPKVLLWLTDGVQPGDVDEPMAELRQQGVAVLAVSTGHGNYQVLRRAVTPPIESHLYFVDIDDIDIILEDLREAIIELIRTERLRVVRLSSHSAVLQWCPVLTAETGYYELSYNCVWRTEGEPPPGTGCSSGQYHRRVLPGDTSREEPSNLQPDTTYTATLTPESNQHFHNTLSVTFTTLPEVLSPAVVLVSDSGPHQVRVSWGPQQPDRVREYRVEYGAFPRGHVQTVTLHGHQNSTLLTGLEPATQYLVTVSALHTSGIERAMSVKACTQEVAGDTGVAGAAVNTSPVSGLVPVAVLPGLMDLRLTSVERGGVQVDWRGSEEGLKGYWLSWEGENSQSPSPSQPSTMYLPPGSPSMRLTHLAPSSRVCVSPVYSSGRGEGICCTAGR